MEKILKPLAILNLSGELIPELMDYFNQRKVQVIDPLTSSEELDWTHIITKDIHDFNLIAKTYDLVEKERHIISLSNVSDLQNFTVNNGNMVLNDLWFKGPMGAFIMDKYFQGHGGITLGDNYPAFREKGAFNVANPFNTGEYLDRLVQTAFEEGAEALTVKTYFDHLLMYVAGLKKKNKAGMPIEVTYGVFDDVFGLQVHFFSNGIDLLDVTTCLSSFSSKKPEEYFLNVAVQAADFFDFSYMPDVNKIVITGLWTKDERLKFENRGLMITPLQGGRVLTSHQTGDVTSTLVPGGELKDLSDKIVIPAQLPEELEKTVVGGQLDRSDEALVVKGDKDLEELVSVVKGKFEEDKAEVVLPSNKLDIEEIALRIASNVDDSAREKNWKIRSMAEKLPEVIKTGLFDFAKGLNKPVEDLSLTELEDFQIESLPEIIKDSLINEIHQDDKTQLVTGEEISDEPLLIKGQSELEELIEVIQGRFEDDKEVIRINGSKLDVDKTAFRIAATIDESTKEKNLKVRSLGDKLPQSIKTGLFDFAKQLNKEVEDLSNADLDQFQVHRLPDIIQEGILNQKLKGGEYAKRMEDDPHFQVLESKLKAMNIENDKLKSQMKTLASEVRILKDTKAQMAEMQIKAVQAAAEAATASAISDQDDELRQHFLQKLTEQKELNAQDQQKLAGLLERESKLIVEVRNEELRTKKLQIEALQKETFFAQQIEKAQRETKAKEAMIVKAKDGFMKLVGKKEQEVTELKNKVDQLSKALASGPSQNQATMLKELERQNQNLSKQLEVYRVKVSSMSSKMQKSDDGNAKEEVRKLQMVNNQLKNQIEIAKKEVLKMAEKSHKDSALLTSLKQEKIKLEHLVKKVSLDEGPTEPLPVSNTNNDVELKRMLAQNQILENQVKEATLKITTLESKLAEALKTQKPVANGEESYKVKQSQLEHSVKKLTQDLIDNRNQLAEMKKDTNKLRQEKTALQNMVDKLKKEMEKSKGAAPKKPGGKAA